jgi:hypothetical protein
LGGLNLWIDAFALAPGRGSAGRRVHDGHLVGFTAVLWCSELAALRVDDTPGLVISIPVSKTNQTGGSTEVVVLPRASSSTG